MGYPKFYILSLILIALMAGAVSVEASVINTVSIEFDRTNGYDSAVAIRGDGIDIAGRYSSVNAPFVCAPCSSNQVFRFGSAFSGTEISASGTINGTFYPNLYLLYTLTQAGQDDIRIPRTWRRSVRIRANTTLTGNIGIWQRPADVGNTSTALVLENNIALSGRAELVLKWQATSGTRLFTDKYLAYTFSILP